MSIKVRCNMCLWTDRVADSLAGETIACRACAAKVAVPISQQPGSSAEFEVVDDVDVESKAAKNRDEKAKSESAATIKAAKKKKTVLPDERPWRISPKFAWVLGLIIVAAGLITLAIDTALAHWRVYPFVLFGVGSLIAIAGYMFDHEVRR
jgi:hypothetical protein